MTCPKKFWFYILISIILLICVIIMDFGLIHISTSLSWDQIREPLLIGFIFFMTIGFSCLDLMKRFSLLAKLRFLGLFIFLFTKIVEKANPLEGGFFGYFGKQLRFDPLFHINLLAILVNLITDNPTFWILL